MFRTLAEGAEEDVCEGVEPAVEMQDATVDYAGVGDVYCNMLPVSAVQFFGKEHHGHLAVGVGADLTIFVGLGVEEVLVEVRHRA